MAEDLRRTPLFAEHVERGAKMVPFAGWEMPISFEGIVAEHKSVRGAAGVFDVSHMGEVDFRGPDALRAIQTLVTNDAARLQDGQAQYTVVCHDHGGIVDDCIVYRFGAEHFRIVVNAANIDKDVAHFHRYADSICDVVDRSDEFALLAVQGPQAIDLFAKLAGDALRDVPSFGLGSGSIGGTEITAARTGYTGEDGFELFVPADAAGDVYRAVLDAGAKPIGLGARDTLRLEARLSLYGNDLTDETNPLEAALGWTVKLGKDVDFVGKQALARIKEEGLRRKLVGFKVDSRGIARPGAEVLGGDGSVVGTVTSGGPAPTVGGAIGLAYVPTELAGPDKPLTLRQRGKELQATQVKGPFYRRS